MGVTRRVCRVLGRPAGTFENVNQDLSSVLTTAPANPADDVMLRPGEVSRLLGVDPKTLTRWADSGKLPAVVLPSGHRRYRLGAIRAVLHGQQAS